MPHTPQEVATVPPTGPPPLWIGIPEVRRVPASAGAETGVMGLAAEALAAAVASAGVDPEVVELTVLAGDDLPPGVDPEHERGAPLLENAYIGGLTRELAWSSGLVHAVLIGVGLLGEPPLEAALAVARSSLLADGLDHVAVAVTRRGGPGKAGAGALVVSRHEVGALRLEGGDLYRGDDPAGRLTAATGTPDGLGTPDVLDALTELRERAR